MGREAAHGRDRRPWRTSDNERSPSCEPSAMRCNYSFISAGPSTRKPTAGQRDSRQNLDEWWPYAPQQDLFYEGKAHIDLSIELSISRSAGWPAGFVQNGEFGRFWPYERVGNRLSRDSLGALRGSKIDLRVDSRNGSKTQLTANKLLALAHQLGRVLTQMKEEIGHGLWLRWLEGRWPQLGVRNAQRCMPLFRYNPRSSESNTSIRRIWNASLSGCSCADIFRHDGSTSSLTNGCR